MKDRKYKINDNFFEKIDTEAKAYILGFMYADGCVYASGTKWAKLDLKSDDISILDKMQKVMDNECPIKTYTYNKKQYFRYSNKTYEFSHSMSRLSMRSNKIVDDLIKLGCISNKTFEITFPKNKIISDSLMHHFIRGYFDGDGSISASSRKSSSMKRSEYLHFSITFTGTYDFVSNIKKILNEKVIKFDGDIRNRWDNEKNNYTLSICGNDIINQILDWLYADSEFYLPRKYEKYLLLKKEIEERNQVKKYADSHRKPMNNAPFNIYKNGIYIGTSNNRRKLARESKNILGENVYRCIISDCLNGVISDYHNISFVFVSDDEAKENVKYICYGKENIKSRKKIIQYDLDMNMIKKWDSVNDALIALNLTKKSSGISSCLTGSQKTAYGYIWKYDLNAS